MQWYIGIICYSDLYIAKVIERCRTMVLFGLFLENSTRRHAEDEELLVGMHRSSLSLVAVTANIS